MPATTMGLVVPEVETGGEGMDVSSVSWKQDHLGAIIEGHHEDMRRYLDLIHQTLRERKADIPRHDSAVLPEDDDPTIPDSDGDITFDDLASDEYELAEAFHRMLYSGVISAWYGYCEHMLYQVCRSQMRVRQLTQLPGMVGKRDGEPKLQRWYRYLQEVDRLAPSTDLHGRFEELRAIGRLRNILVHDNGELLSGERDGEIHWVRKFAHQHTTLISLDEFRFPSKTGRDTVWIHLNISYEFCVFFLEAGLAFFRQLFYELHRTSSPHRFRTN